MLWFQRSQIPDLSASTANLRRICWLRGVLMLCELAGLAIACTILQQPLPASQLFIIAMLNTVFIALTLWRLAALPFPVTGQELLWQLGLDILWQSLLLYFTGGYTNPLVSIYLVIITTGAALLPVRQSWLLTMLAILAYTLLMNCYLPLGSEIPVAFHDSQQQMINLHLLGMWFTFVISALLINYFVVNMARALCKQSEDIATSRERQLRDETIIAVAIQAAGAAHELGTPLSTMAVLLGDLHQEHNKNPALADDLRLLRTQVEECKKKLNQLVQSSRYAGVKPIVLTHFLEQILEQWQLVRPGTPIFYAPPSKYTQPVIQYDLSVTQSVIALLDNAAKSCPENLRLSVIHNKTEATIRIDDQGDGISEAISSQAGMVIFNSTHKEGMGLGLLLSCASIERLGGRVLLYNRSGGGGRTEIVLPIWKES